MRRTNSLFAVALAAALAAAPSAARATMDPARATGGQGAPQPSASSPASPSVPASAAGAESGGPLFDGSSGAKNGGDVVVSDPGLNVWLDAERRIALRKMEANISPKGGAPGSVAASPSRENPNYWYNWRRDAALTMDEVVALYSAAADTKQKASFEKMMTDYAAFVRKEQTAKTLTGLGEPKFNMDGSAFNEPWGRPQDDTPAEEASTLIGFASALLKAGKKDQAAKLYGDMTTGIKGDLEYVSHHRQETSFDVWEEVKAHHFDTQMAQRTALYEGAWLADQLGDHDAATWYHQQAVALEAALAAHWDPKAGYIDSAVDRDGGLDYKASDLDAAVILGAIHRRPLDGAVENPPQLSFFSPTDARVLATAEALKQKFRSEYAINAGGPGVAIGRYPEDKYVGGNPWVLLTAAYAQLEYMAAAEYESRGAIPIEAADLSFFQELVGDPADKAALKAGATLSSGDPLFDKVIKGLASDGDLELACIKKHANADGSLSEQMDKDSGYMASARDLTWNYASMLTALQARDALASARLARSLK